MEKRHFYLPEAERPAVWIFDGGLKIAGAPETRLDSILFFCGFRNRPRDALHHILAKRAKRVDILFLHDSSLLRRDFKRSPSVPPVGSGESLLTGKVFS